MMHLAGIAHRRQLRGFVGNACVVPSLYSFFPLSFSLVIFILRLTLVVHPCALIQIMTEHISADRRTRRQIFGHLTHRSGRSTLSYHAWPNVRPLMPPFPTPRIWQKMLHSYVFRGCPQALSNSMLPTSHLGRRMPYTPPSDHSRRTVSSTARIGYPRPNMPAPSVASRLGNRRGRVGSTTKRPRAPHTAPGTQSVAREHRIAGLNPPAFAPELRLCSRRHYMAAHRLSSLLRGLWVVARRRSTLRVR